MRSIIFLVCLLTTTYTNAADFVLKTSAFANKSTIPVVYTCDGKDISPALQWENAPANTQTFALLLTDPDAPAGTWYHWIWFNMPNTVNSLAEGEKTLPTGTLQGKNSWGNASYNGPCPPKGSEHHYIFTLYALDTKLDLTAESQGDVVLHAMEKHILKQAQMSGVFSH